MSKKIRYKATVVNDRRTGYLRYPDKEDIYKQAKEERDLDPEDPTKTKTPNEKKAELNEKDFEDDISGDDLDIPGSELDDEMEKNGSEDEENNYYSFGSDNHIDNENDKGD